MQCKSCGTILPMGITACPTCGAPTPFAKGNAAQQVGVTAHSDATVASSSPYGVEPSAPYGGPQQDFNGEPISNPYTKHTYGEPGTSSAPNNVYGDQPPVNPYEQANGSYNNISLPGTGTSNPYENTIQAPPPPPPGLHPQVSPAPFQQQGFSQPQQYQQPQPQQARAPQPFQQQAPRAAFQPRPPTPPASFAPPERRNSSNLIRLGIFLLIIILIGVAIVSFANKNRAGTGSNANAPSGSPVSGSASSIITNVRMVSKQGNEAPEITDFGVNKPIYALFNPQLNGQPVYAIAKWYGNGQLLATTDVLTLNPNYQYQYFMTRYSTPTAGSVEVYSCMQADCSDAKLAATKQFTITGDGGSKHSPGNGSDQNGSGN